MSQPRALAPEDRARIMRAANEWAKTGSFAALRTRAFVWLAASSGLRLKELRALNLDQLLDRTQRGWRLRELCYLRKEQSKGRRTGERKQWDSAGAFVLTKATRAVLRAYLLEARRRGWIAWPPKPGEPLFVTVKGRGATANHHVRISRRSMQEQWKRLQLRAQVPELYSAHCLRHEAMTRISGVAANALEVAAFGRCDVRTAQRYTHVSPARIVDLAERASRPVRAQR